MGRATELEPLGHMGSLVRSWVFAVLQAPACPTLFLTLLPLPLSLIFPLPPSLQPRMCLNLLHHLKHVSKLLLNEASTLYPHVLILFHIFLFLTKCLRQTGVFTIITFLTSIQSSTHCHLVGPQPSTETVLTHITNSPLQGLPPSWC